MSRASNRILVVDDEVAIRTLFSQMLRSGGYEPLEAADGEEALALVRDHSPDAVLLDVRLPGLDGMEILRRVKLLDPRLPVIMVTGGAVIRQAITAVRTGAFDYLVKPVESIDLMRSISNALSERGPDHTDVMLRAHMKDGESLRDSMGPSVAVARLCAEVARVASSDFTVLILGETGSGKELVSRAIHAASPRARAPLVAVDCGAIPETLFESELFGHEKGAFTGSNGLKRGRLEIAEAGTLFLDEISNMPRGCQAKLLRALQERRMYRVGGTKPTALRARVVAASNEDVEACVAKGLFRSDLFFRISEFIIRIPPLRERKEDIAYLAQRFVAQASRELGKSPARLSEGALQRLIDYDWPGNVRQLCSTVRRAVLLADEEIREPHLGLVQVFRSPRESEHELVASAPVGAPLKQIVSHAAKLVERQALMEALRAAGGNKAKAARMLRIDYKTIHLKLKVYGLKRDGGGTR